MLWPKSELNYKIILASIIRKSINIDQTDSTHFYDNVCKYILFVYTKLGPR